MAKWEDLVYHTVTFISTSDYPFIPIGSSEEVTEYTVKVLDGETVPEPYVEPTYGVYYEFVDWRMDETFTKYDFSTPVETDIILRLNYTILGEDF